MERLEVLITLLHFTVTVPAGATTGTVSVPTTADTIDENNETLLPLELLRLLEQSMIMMRLNCSHDHSCFGYQEVPVFEFSLSNPSAVDTTYTFTFTNGTAGSADYTTTTLQ
jgi:hypothetical protein